MSREQILSSRQQADVWNRSLEERLDDLLPELMEREGFDAWIIAGREYNEGPLLPTFLPEPMLTARRLTILLMVKTGKQLERFSFSPPYPELEPLYRPMWQGDQGQWEALAEYLKNRPELKFIAVGSSEDNRFSDGLSSGLYQSMQRVFTEIGGRPLLERLKSADHLAISWLERRSPLELERYASICALAHRVIDRVFSRETIVPGYTSSDDLAWLFRQEIESLGLSAWFMPTVDFQRRGEAHPRAQGIIKEGDLLHCDIGLRYLGLCTDTQRLAYVRPKGEELLPAGIEQLVKEGNQLQDLLCAEFRSGKSGNEILLSTLDKARSRGMVACVYSHPIGFHGHGAGPCIGLYNKQEAIPGAGEYPLYPDTCYAIELNAAQAVPEWDGQIAYAYLEETALFDGAHVVFFDQRQTEPILI